MMQPEPLDYGREEAKVGRRLYAVLKWVLIVLVLIVLAFLLFVGLMVLHIRSLGPMGE